MAHFFFSPVPELKMLLEAALLKRLQIFQKQGGAHRLFSVRANVWSCTSSDFVFSCFACQDLAIESKDVYDSFSMTVTSSTVFRFESVRKTDVL